ncbi:hypothetical protein ACVDG8_015230 [Mesorhizobium sp. ORM8.1]
MPARSADFAPLAIEAGYDVTFEPPRAGCAVIKGLLWRLLEPAPSW